MESRMHKIKSIFKGSMKYYIIYLFIMSFTFFIGKDAANRFIEGGYELSLGIALMALFIAIGTLITAYLKSGVSSLEMKTKEGAPISYFDNDEPSTSNVNEIYIKNITGDINKKTHRINDLDFLKYFETSIKKVSEEAIAIGAKLSEKDKSEIVDSIKKSIGKELGNTLLLKISETYGDKIIASKQHRVYRRLYEMTMERLRSETQALTNRSNLNLILGTLITLLSLGFLVFVVITSKDVPHNLLSLASFYISRLSIVLFLELFAYFFLRLYKSCLQEIKYFQNELTNTEIKFLSFEAAIESADKEIKRSVLISLSQCERNFILNKGQTTVELEKAKGERSAIKDVLKTLVDGINPQKLIKK